MKLRGPIIAGIVLAALMGGLYWSNRHKPAETTEASTEAAPKILALNTSDISKLELKKKDSDVVVQKDKAGKWEIMEPKPLPADQSAVESLIGTFSSLESDRLVEDKAANLDPYGLTSPSLEVNLTEKDNKSKELLLGDTTPTGNDVYAKLGDDARVFTMPSYHRTSIDKSANDLRDKRLLTVDADKVSRVELIAKKQDMEFGRNKDEWQILKPKPLRADSDEVGNLVRELADAQMEISDSDDAKKVAAAFASATPVATAKVTDESGTQQIDVRKNKDDYYAKSSVVDGVYKVNSSLGQQVDKGMGDFRNKKVFDFGFDDPKKMEIHDSSKTYFLTKGGDDWFGPDGKKLDAGGAESVLEDVRDLSATKFVDSGFTSPVLEFVITDKDGKRIEKAQVSKSGDNYIAKRENDPSLYQIDAKSVEDLQKALADLKPVAPPAKK